MKKIAVVLSGCGFKDGSEITEAVSTLVALSELKVNYKVFGANLDVPATNHLNGKREGSRNALAEAARIARGDIVDLAELREKDFDGVVFPGGFGAATVLC